MRRNHTTMLAPDQTYSEFALPAIDVRSVARRVALPGVVAVAAFAAVLLVGGHVNAIAQTVQRGLGVGAGWAVTGVAFESISLGGYVLLLSLVASRATPRITTRVSAQITLAGAAATRLLPTAGAGGAALALWTFHRAGLRSRAAARTLLAFEVLLYAVFLGSIVLAGVALALGVVPSHGPLALSAVPAGAAIAAITLALVLSGGSPSAPDRPSQDSAWRARAGTAARMLGDGVRDARRLAAAGDPRLAGAIAYWLFDAATLWAMLHAFGTAPVVPVVALAYFVGQVATTLPIPGSVSGGIAGVLIAFGVPVQVALPSVLAYRAIAVWLPTPVAIAAVPGLRSTIARWAREDSAGDYPATASQRS